MFSDFNTLLWGEPAAAADVLAHSTTVDEDELRAALVNALNHIARLENELLKFKQEMGLI